MLGLKLITIGYPTIEVLAFCCKAAVLWPYRAPVIWPPGGTEVGLRALFLDDVWLITGDVCE